MWSDRTSSGDRARSSDRNWSSEHSRSGGERPGSDRARTGDRPWDRNRAGTGDRTRDGDHPRTGNRAGGSDRAWSGNRAGGSDRPRSGNRAGGSDRPRSSDRAGGGDRARSGDRARGSDRAWDRDRAGGSRERPGAGRTWAGRDETPARPPREPGPQLPDSITPEQLDPEARAQLNSLPNDLADIVARYLVAAELADDPEQGRAYAQAAKRLAARVGVVREACGIAAYQTGRWAEALSELRAARRMTGRDDYLPIMADCERALGRLDRALALVREANPADLDRAMQIELRIVESGIRRDQGLPDAAVLALQVPELASGRLRPWSARLFYAYADALLAAGRVDEARDAFVRAAEADPQGQTDAAERLDELDGIEFDDLEDEDLDPEGSDLQDADVEENPTASHPD